MSSENSWYEVEVHLRGVPGPAYMSDSEMLELLNEKLSALGFTLWIDWVAIKDEEADEENE